MVYFLTSLFSTILISITNVVWNLKPLNSINKSPSLFLVADSVFLSCSLGLKGFEISIPEELA